MSNLSLGAIQLFAGTFVVQDYSACDGASLMTAPNPALYSVLGNRFGGDATNFNLPKVSNLSCTDSGSIQYQIYTVGIIGEDVGTSMSLGAGLTGEIVYTAADAAPLGFLACDGASLSTTNYADLYKVIQHTFGGSGDSFNLPNIASVSADGSTGTLGAYIRTGAAAAGDSTPDMASVMLWGGATAPAGWAFCDGANTEVSKNGALFSLLGTTFGSKDDQHFNLPNIADNSSAKYIICVNGMFPSRGS